MPLSDCLGVNCPLGIPHPPPAYDPRRGGVFPLGCGICRSEKMDLLKNTNIKQARGVTNRPKPNIKGDGPQIVFPLFEIDLPEFIARADEMLEE